MTARRFTRSSRAAIVALAIACAGCPRGAEPRPPSTGAPAAAAPDAGVDAGTGTGDVDGDMVLDACDRCPYDPETYNHVEDDDGCVERIHPRQDDGVFFAHDDWRLDTDSLDLLARLAETQLGDPAIERIAVVARAAAGERDPEQLSERRAKAVIDALVAAGVSSSRLSAVALGDAPAPADGRDEDVLGRRTALVVIREDGVDIALEDGRTLQLYWRLPPAPPPPAVPGCPLGPLQEPVART